MKRLLAGLACLVTLAVGLRAEKAEVSAFIQGSTVTVRLVIPAGMYSYASSPWASPITVQVPEKYERVLGMAVLPQGSPKGEEVIVKGTADIVLPVMPGTGRDQLEGLHLTVHYQLCNEAQNLCFLPQTATVEVPLAGWAGLATNQVSASEEAERVGRQSGPLEAKTPETREGPTKERIAPPDESLSEAVARLVSENIDSPLFAFLLAILGGFLASLTPCVYPVIPVTLAFFAERENLAAGTGPERIARPVADERRVRRKRFLSALVYVAGMGVVYTLLGLIAGLAGGAFGAFVNKPPFFAALALLYLALALSLFDVWELRLPNFAARFTNSATKKGNGFLTALVMGALTGLVASPCVGPIVFFILTGVLQQGDPVYGAFLMIGFSLGMGLLFLLLALAGGKISHLPKSGNWMVRIKICFGAFVFVSGLYFLGQALTDRIPAIWQIILYLALTNGALIVGWTRVSGLYGKEAKHGPFLGAMLTLVLVLFLLTQAASLVLSAPKEKLAALSDWNISLDEGIGKARETGRPVFVDVGASWCAVCRELKAELGRNPAFRRHIEKHAIPVYLDYDREKARLEEFGVSSLPWVMLLDSEGRLIWKKSGFDRLTGLLAEISNILPQTASGLKAE